MKRILAILFVLIFIGNISVQAGVRVWEENNERGDYQYKAVKTTVIVPGRSKILGFTVMAYDLTKNSELVVGLYDTITNADDAGTNITEVIAEAEVIDGSFDGMWFPYPMTLDTQLWIHQGPNTTVLVYHSR